MWYTKYIQSNGKRVLTTRKLLHINCLLKSDFSTKIETRIWKHKYSSPILWKRKHFYFHKERRKISSNYSMSYYKFPSTCSTRLFTNQNFLNCTPCSVCQLQRTNLLVARNVSSFLPVGQIPEELENHATNWSKGIDWIFC